MKEFINFISKITGIARSVVTILFLLGIFFTGLVSANLLLAFVDMLGFTGISEAIIKPIFFIISGLMFIINLVITRNIFRAGKSGQYHLSNLVFALLFLALDAFMLVALRNEQSPLIYILLVVNGLIVINSILGLIARGRGLYVEENQIQTGEAKEADYIEFDDTKDNLFTAKETEPINTANTKKDQKVISETKISPTGEIKTTKINKELSDNQKKR